jgi:hypothetical protein
MRRGKYHIFLLHLLTFTSRWVYKRFFVADGNFKADHVRQKNTDADIWLSEGGGMMSKRSDYEEFLKSAIERSTASHNLVILVTGRRG